MTTFKAVVLKHHIKPDKTVRIKIKVTHNHVRKFIDTGLVATTDDLTKANAIKSQYFKDSTRRIIKEYRDKCNNSPVAVKQMSVEQLIKFLTDTGEEINFIKFAQDQIEKLKAAGRKGVASNHNTAINALIRFIGGTELNVKEITVNFLQNFESFIRTKPLSENNKSMVRAPSSYMSSIRSLHNELKKHYNNEDIGVIVVPYSPFSKYKLPSEGETRKRAIEPEKVEAIYSLPDDLTKNNAGGNRFNIAKDCFLLSFALIGMNSVDMYNCCDYKNGYITYNRSKTSTRRKDKAVISIFVQPEIEHLFEKYRDTTGIRVFNFHQKYSTPGTFNAAINKGLKEVGKNDSIKLDDLEFYAARHSWATIALNDVKIDKFIVHSALNHVDDSMKVTDIYLKKDFSLINEANRKVLDFIFKNMDPV